MGGDGDECLFFVSINLSDLLVNLVGGGERVFWFSEERI